MFRRLPAGGGGAAPEAHGPWGIGRVGCKFTFPRVRAGGDNTSPVSHIFWCIGVGVYIMYSYIQAYEGLVLTGLVL